MIDVLRESGLITERVHIEEIEHVTPQNNH